MKTFTATQTARGILTTIMRGNWTLAATRLREVKPAQKRRDAAEQVSRALSADERAIWNRYYQP